MGMQSPAGVPHSRLGSGTSWVPDSSPMREAMIERGAWMFSLHGAGYLQYDDQLTKRGDRQPGITDWEMLMAMRPLAGGELHLHAMTSIEPFVLGGAGYPELLQNGGTYRGAPIHDRQHPHMALMELAAMYDRPVGGPLSLTVYAAPAGEPALGPVAFMHRPSAENDPFAPLGHHWQDATHESAGVLTLGLFTHTLKLEASAFNAREADETHPVVDYRGARLDSYSARVTWMATPHVAAAAWQGFLAEHERLDPSTRMHRYGASVLLDGRGPSGGRWSSAFVWGMNVHDHGGLSHELAHAAPGASPHHASHSVLAESNLEIGARSAVFARVERAQKNGEEMGFSGGDLTTLYDIRSVVAGATRTIATAGAAEFALGARASVNFVPETLLLTYGTRTPSGFAVYLRVRPRGR